MIWLIQLSESYKHHTTVKTKQDFKDDIAQIPSLLPAPKTPASIAYRLDTKEMGKWEWMMITYVPDDAGVSVSDIIQADAQLILGGRYGRRCSRHLLNLVS